MEWSCVQTRTGEEEKARRWITSAGFEVYLPLCRERRVVRPLFRRYLFAKIGEQWHGIALLPGVAGILMSGERPAKLRMVITDKRKRGRSRPSRVLSGDEVIERLRAQAGPDGVIDFARRSGVEPYAKGTLLRVRDSWHVLGGLDLSFVGMRGQDRVRVMLEWFGRSQVVDLDADLVRAI